MLKKYLGEVMIFVVTLIGASGWFLSKYSMEELPPIGFIGLRFFLAFLLFLPFALPQLTRLNKPQILRASAVGFANILNIVLWVLGLIHSTHLGEGAFLVSLAMLIAPLLSWLLFQHKPPKLFALSLPIAVLGLYWLSAEKGAFQFSLGSIIFLCSSLAAALYFVLNNQFVKNVPALALTTVQLGMIGICCGVYSYFMESWPTQISPHIWGWFAGSVLLATNVRVLLQTVGQKYCDVTNAAIIMLLEPVWTLWLSVLFLSEPLSWQKILGCVCILSALVIYRLPYLIKK